MRDLQSFNFYVIFKDEMGVSFMGTTNSMENSLKMLR